ncbi:MAG: NTP transferase domain-containing protein [Deltaproteobacteria bacterium]|nr:NTP transferase domain-containing protein [Deltaproteobacteria bacterium]MBW2658952.1 NTP transferase domain-containing protein [Deltaproteobacteria bacterium]
MQAMILAAGFGTRLQPHTLIRPKPLFPVLNQPLLLLTVKRLQNLGFSRIVVNCHHLREQIVAALDGIKGVIVQEEDTLLGTGGGLRRALKHFDDKPLLVTNGDIYHTLDFKDLYRFHREEGLSVTLAMRNNHRFNTVAVRDGRVVSFDDRTEQPLLTFTGIHMVDPKTLTDIDENSFSSIIDHYRKCIDSGLGIGCYQDDDCFWTDMGSPDDYIRLHAGLLKGKIPCWAEAGPVKGPFHVHKRAVIPSSVRLADWVCIGDGAVVGDRSHLERVIAWSNVSIAPGERIVGDIIS